MAAIDPNKTQQVPTVSPPPPPPSQGKTDFLVDTKQNESVITDAKAMVDIAEIMAGTQYSKMNADKLAEKLRERGYQVEVFKTERGRDAIRFQNGDILADSAGDASIGYQDINFSESLALVEAKYGTNLSGLKAKLEAGAYAHKMRKQGESIYGATGPYSGLYDLTQQAGVTPTDQLDIEELMAEVDGQMAAAGYNGQERAVDLWNAGRLQEVLAQLGLNLTIPRLQDVAYDLGMTHSLGLFGLAYDVASHLSARR